MKVTVVEVYRWRLLLLRCKGEGERCWCVLLKFTVECMGAEFYIGDGLHCSMYSVYVYRGISVTVYMLMSNYITLSYHCIVQRHAYLAGMQVSLLTKMFSLYMCTHPMYKCI